MVGSPPHMSGMCTHTTPLNTQHPSKEPSAAGGRPEGNQALEAMLEACSHKQTRRALLLHRSIGRSVAGAAEGAEGREEAPDAYGFVGVETEEADDSRNGEDWNEQIALSFH